MQLYVSVAGARAVQDTFFWGGGGGGGIFSRFWNFSSMFFGFVAILRDHKDFSRDLKAYIQCN